jgi:FtsZ-binding cell division protein ZapB
LLHNADQKKVTLCVETSQVQNLENVNEMNEFVKCVLSSNIPEFGKSNVISKLGSISKTQNLINDFEQLKHDYEMLKQNFNIIKNQNDMLVQENKNIQNSSCNYSDEIKSLRDQLMVNISIIILLKIFKF